MNPTFKKKDIVLLSVFVLLVAGLAIFMNFSTDSASPVYSGTNGLDIDNGDTKINWSKYPSETIDLSESIDINRSGIYYLSGDIDDGSITIDVGDTNGVAKLVLDDVNIYCSDGPAIYIKSADDVIIETKKDSENSLISGKAFRTFEEDDNVNGTIYSKGDLSFYGEGILYVESNFQDAIVSKDDLVIRSGELQVKSADDGIRGKDSVYVTGGKIFISAKQDGIKSTNEENAQKGFVYIEDGDIEIDVSDDGIHATSVLIVDDGKINVLNSYEGLEGGKVIINGGDIDIVSTDDGINVAGGNDESAFMRPGSQNFANNTDHILIINDGDIYVNAAGDGLDSNGLVYINGGKVAIDGPKNSANGALDSENGIYFNGGSVIAVGASGMAEAFSDGSLCFGVNIFFNSTLAKNTIVSIRDTNGNELISHTSVKIFDNAVIGLESLEFGSTYSIYINNNFYNNFTVSDYVTIVGEDKSTNINGGMPGGFQGGEMGAPNDFDGDRPELPAEPNGERPDDFDNQMPSEENGKPIDKPDEDNGKLKAR